MVLDRCGRAGSTVFPLGVGYACGVNGWGSMREQNQNKIQNSGYLLGEAKDLV